MKKLLGISLALVMVLGTIPLGFSESLKVQLEQGIETEQLQCNNLDHVLVLRTNGNVACVSDRTAEKLGWEIIQSSDVISKIMYDFPLVATTESNEPILSGVDFKVEISSLPKMGGTAVLTVIATTPDV